ncbi:hypothetical protein PV08_01241 [Exophiala spinifera]|uniref:protein S-acyltransferase n=1 Tax=Exophiala spinifera TaxID=91928 RepID=A0A0D2CAR0_9EURO|nr:uncharacterized protein PV08_01241 [Exophiala spinifera]KIW20664.1 hypothetical protein PV08_01241 [Exophiala spinifera]
MATATTEARPLRIKLTKAVTQKKDEDLARLLQDEDSSRRNDENDLRALLSKAISIGYEHGVKLLLDAGAKTDVVGNHGPLQNAIASANDKTRNAIITLLLDRGCELEAKDATGRTPLMAACLRGQSDVILTLLARGADPNLEDATGKNCLQIMASESKRKTDWSPEALSALLPKFKDLNKRDSHGREGRTPLLWAAARNQLTLVDALLKMGKGVADINQSNDQGHSALHLAARHDEPEMIKLLIFMGARIEARSDGDWTPLLMAAKEGNEKAIDALLTSKANVNARTSSGMTSLHWAADSGKLAALNRLLREPDALTNSKDSFDSTPLIRAAQNGHWDIVNALRPYVLKGPTNRIARKACERFRAAVVNFFEDKDGRGNVKHKNKVNKQTVWQIVYARNQNNPEKPAIPIALDQVEGKKPSFRWIHLPANNISWLEALLTRYYLESDTKDVTALKSLLRLLGRQQHRGSEIHSRFMRPSCKRIWIPPRQASEQTQATPQKLSHQNNRRAAPSTPPPPPSARSTAPAAAQSQQEDDMMVLFMPYLHWETDRNRTSLTQSLRAPAGNTDSLDDSELSRIAKDILLIHGYVSGSTDLHPRRTLDQFKHHSTKTDHQDADQVVYRYCKKRRKELKVFMVDQLWMISIGNLLISCFPERWKQPHRDPLNLFEGVVEDINSSTRPPVRNVFELATVITERCTGLFDRQQWDNDDLLFAEMFELSIGRLTRKETKLFRRFKEASSHWLRSHEGGGNVLYDSRMGLLDQEDDDHSSDWSSDELHDHHHHQHHHDGNSIRHAHRGTVPASDTTTAHRHQQMSGSFDNDLLNIDKEAALLVECKDVEDELDILTSVLHQQQQVLNDFDATLRTAKRLHHRLDLYNKVGEQRRLVDLDILDLGRMTRQAKSVNDNLTQVLDLKQKHANALEARFQRKQAEESVRQGQTIMVFTIVTIVFLPLSFLASFFTINIAEFPRPPGSQEGNLHLGWVVKWILGIGFALSVPLIGLAFVVGDVQTWWVNRKLDRHRRRKEKEDAMMMTRMDMGPGSGGVYGHHIHSTPDTSRGERRLSGGGGGGVDWLTGIIMRQRNVPRPWRRGGGGVGNRHLGLPVSRQRPIDGFDESNREGYIERATQQQQQQQAYRANGAWDGAAAATSRASHLDQRYYHQHQQHPRHDQPDAVSGLGLYQQQQGRQAMSSMESSRHGGNRFPRRLRRVGTETTERSAATEDLEVGSGGGGYGN